MKNINLNIKDQRAAITLCKPPLNIFDIEDLHKLAGIIKSLKDRQDIKIITIESDQKVFSAGVDISDHSEQNAHAMLEAFHSVFFEMLELEILTISLVKSGCIGGGCELALFSDFVLASEKAYFSQPEIKLGCFPPVSMVYFPYITGNKQALEMILLGDKVYAQDALSYGLVNKVFPDGDFDAEANRFIDLITSKPAQAVRTTLKAYKRMNYKELREKIKLSEKVYLEEINHDTISLK